ncbi:anti-sigma factor family protein [Pleurocapsa sp. FMAR1]|uniref:anti-sigma factor family protein n=1 Tax=Pleurocapsa sp. FMAR1 TaxID=3040204 RepID=UPI0029C77786|nr:hypothetical protein [Pleurocapsa sp. FMAR1]
MTSNFEGFESDIKQIDSKTEDSALDYFELLSAYVDGELSTPQKNQVQALLDRDPQVKQVYTQLLTLQSQMQQSIAPPCEKSVDEITKGVFRLVDHRRRRRKLVWGGGAIAASLFAIISGIIPGISPAFKMAKLDAPAAVNSSAVMLAVAVNKPAINIPKSATGYSLKTNSTRY